MTIAKSNHKRSVLRLQYQERCIDHLSPVGVGQVFELRITVNGDQRRTLPLHAEVWNEVAKAGSTRSSRILNLHVMHQRAPSDAKSTVCKRALDGINIVLRRTDTSKCQRIHLK